MRLGTLNIRLVVFSLVSMFLFSVVGFDGAHSVLAATEPESVLGEFVVGVRGDIGVASGRRFDPDEMRGRGYGVRRILSGEIGVAGNGIGPDLFTVTAGRGADIDSIRNELGAYTNVDFVEPNYVFRLTKSPNDPLYGNQYYLNDSSNIDINAPETWDITTGSSSVVVAVLDSGIDPDHPEFSDKLVAGYDFVDNDSNPDTSPGTGDENGAHHGTAVAGVIGAATNNNSSISGVCWSCRIMPIRVTDSDGVGTTVELVEGINYASSKGAEVISISLIGGYSEAVGNAITTAESRGSLVIAAAGNNNLDLDSAQRSPVSNDYVLGVGSLTRGNEKSSFSNYGSAVDVSAPGENIVTLKYLDSAKGMTAATGTYTGTSFSTPIVSGIAGLLASRFPSDTPQELRERITTNVSSFAGGTSNMGSGRPNAYTALAESGSFVTAPGPGGGPHVRAFSSAGASDPFTNFFPYSTDFRGGVYVASGDVDGDGSDEIITGAGAGGGPHLRTFEKDGTVKSIQFFPFDQNFRGGLQVAAGDVDGDGKDEVGVCQASAGQAWLKVYRTNSERTILAYGNVFGAPEVGCSIDFGDVDGDGKDEVVVGAGPGGGPHVRVYDVGSAGVSGPNQGMTLKPISYFMFATDNRSGIDVAAGDVDGDGVAEIGASQLTGDEAWTKVVRYNSSKQVIGNFRAFPQGVESGAFLELADVDGDGKAEALVGPGEGGGPQVRAFEAYGADTGINFFAYDTGFRGGVRVTKGNF